jgi:hypothetical protein
MASKVFKGGKGGRVCKAVRGGWGYKVSKARHKDLKVVKGGKGLQDDRD